MTNIGLSDCIVLSDCCRPDCKAGEDRAAHICLSAGQPWLSGTENVTKLKHAGINSTSYLHQCMLLYHPAPPRSPRYQNIATSRCTRVIAAWITYIILKFLWLRACSQVDPWQSQLSVDYQCAHAQGRQCSRAVFLRRSFKIQAGALFKATTCGRLKLYITQVRRFDDPGVQECLCVTIITVETIITITTII